MRVRRQRPALQGLVTERDLAQAEQEWPGLRRFLRRIPFQERPATFLDLVWRYERWRVARRRPTRPTSASDW